MVVILFFGGGGGGGLNYFFFFIQTSSGFTINIFFQFLEGFQPNSMWQVPSSLGRILINSTQGTQSYNKDPVNKFFFSQDNSWLFSFGFFTIILSFSKPM